MAVYFFGGINGVGKTSLIEEISFRAPHLQKKHTSSMFMEWLQLKPGDYETLRELPDGYKRAQNEAMLTHYLKELTPTEDVLLDSHYLTLINGSTSKIISGSWPYYLGTLVLIEANIEDIYIRILHDAPFRNRSLFPPGLNDQQKKTMLHRYLLSTRHEFTRTAKRYNLPTLIIQNSDIQRSAGIFLEYIRLQK